MRRTLTGERGFTFVEILVVILLIAVLAAVAIPTFLSQQAKAKDPQAKSAVRNAASALEAFYASTGSYDGATKAALEEVEPSLNEVADENFEVTPNGTAGYELRVKHADTGNEFTISKNGGVTVRTCTIAGKAGCPPGGMW